MIPQTVPDSTIFVEDSAGLPVFGAILSNTVFYRFVRGIQNSKGNERKIAVLGTPQKFCFRPVAEGVCNSQNAQFGIVMIDYNQLSFRKSSKNFSKKNIRNNYNQSKNRIGHLTN